VRPDTSADALRRLAPVFRTERGTVTAGNASPLADGAAALDLRADYHLTTEVRLFAS